MAKEEQKKLSYEELEKIAIQATQENNFLKGKLQEYSDFAGFKRLDYLFKVIENRDAFHSDFVIKVSEELEFSMYPPVSKNSEQENPEGE